MTAMVLRALRLYLAVALFAATGVHAYEVRDTAVPARNEVYWIDNSHVLFPGFERSAGSASQPLRSALLVWDTDARRLRRYAEIPDGDYVCYSRGYISYAVRRDGKRYVREGRLGKEKEREWRAATSELRNELTCRDMTRADLEKVYPGFLFIPLGDGDGYYGWKKTDSIVEANRSPLYYLPPGKGKKPVALPIPVGEKDRISYSEYLRAYAIEYTPGVRDEHTTGKLRILHRNGTVDEQTIPAGPWLRGSVGYTPAKNGIVLSSPALGLRSESDVGDAGVYLVQGGKVERMVVGFPSRYVAVSPDGCRAAAVVRVQKPKDVKATLRIIDMCGR